MNAPRRYKQPPGPGTDNPNRPLLIGSASFDTTVKLWDVEHPEACRTLGAGSHGHSKPIYSIAFSPSGEYLVSGSIDNSLLIWSVKVREERRGEKRSSVTAEHTHARNYTRGREGGLPLERGMQSQTQATPCPCHTRVSPRLLSSPLPRRPRVPRPRRTAPPARLPPLRLRAAARDTPPPRRKGGARPRSSR